MAKYMRFNREISPAEVETLFANRVESLRRIAEYLTKVENDWEFSQKAEWLENEGDLSIG